ncbi:MAG TPA: hypothetical protein VFS56_10220 [Gemmatimonadaceae bacterium]|nr:hypothetical protein [Gemmatimonadaceae bacterium]
MRSFACLAGFAGCLRSTEAQPSQLELTGDWIYSGVQAGAVRENLAGQLRITSVSGTSFQGRLDIVGTNEATGESRVMSGLVSGTGQSDIVDFDAHVETTARRHVGQVVADTITGTWVASSPGGAMSSGTFRAERASP